MKVLDLSSATARVVSDLSKGTAILSYTTLPRSVVKEQDLKRLLATYVGFKDFTSHQKKTNKTLNFRCGPFNNILKYRQHKCDLPTI